MNNTFLETIKAVEGIVYHIDYHQKRYESVLEKFDIKGVKDLSSYINPPSKGVYRCRLTYDLSQTPHKMDVTYHKYKKRAVNSLKLVECNDIDYSLKSTCRDKLDMLYEKREKCDDILIIKNSFVTDTTIANIAFYDSNRWVTPASPLLRGTTRERFLEEGKIFEEDIHVNDLKKFSKIALMNAMIDFDIITKNAKEVLCWTI